MMSMKGKREAVLAKLREFEEEISLQNLLGLLGAGYSERTVRRWLSDLIKEGLAEKRGLKRGTLYRAKQEPLFAERIFSPQSKRIIEKIQRPLFQRDPVTYHDTWLDQYISNKTHYVPNTIKQQLQQAGEQTLERQPAGTYAKRIYNRLLIDLSYNSSRLEGNTYSLLETKRLLLEGTDAEGKLTSEKIMILNHKEAIRYLVDNAHRLRVDINEIYTLHYLLSDGLVPAQYAGKVRDHGVKISSSQYIPLENPKHLERKLQSICQKASEIINPFEQSFFLLVHLAYLQTFIDVNKRTSRLSANIPLIHHNLVPLSFNDVNKEDYINALIAIYEFNEIQPLLEIYVFSYLHTCKFYETTAVSVGFDEIRVRYRVERRALIREIILKLMHGNVMHDYIQKQSNLLVKADDQENFIEDVEEDLEALGTERTAGLGVTPEELQRWLGKR